MGLQRDEPIGIYAAASSVEYGHEFTTDLEY